MCRTIEATPPSHPMLQPDRPLSEVEFVAFDLETTGLFPVVIPSRNMPPVCGLIQL